jgi:hypothetical protein
MKKVGARDTPCGVLLPKTGNSRQNNVCVHDSAWPSVS